MPRSLALAVVLLHPLVTGAGVAAAGRVLLKKDAASGCKDQIALHQPEGLRAVDWCNHSYLGKDISLKAGRGEMHEYAEMGAPHDTRLSDLQDVAYLDVDGDGVVEALVVIHRVDWFVHDDGSSTSREYSSIFVHAWVDSKPAVIGVVDAAAAPVYAIAAF